MKKYRDFAFPHVAVGLLIGLLVFGFTIITFKYRYEATLHSGNSDMIKQYEKLIDKYDSGDIGVEFINMMNEFYRFDYLRISEIDDSGSITPIFETDYDTVAASINIHNWIFVTKDDSLAGTQENYNEVASGNGFELNMSYVKCDEIWEPIESLDMYNGNSYNLLAFSESWYYSYPDPFVVVAEVYGNYAFPCLIINSYYIDGDTLHLGSVRRGITSLPFAKTWDFTDKSSADKYIYTGPDDSFVECISYGMPVRPDKYLDAESDIFMQDSMEDIYASGKLAEGSRTYTSTLDDEGRLTFGGVRIYETGGHRYLIESVITAQSFTGYFMPFIIIYAFILMLIFIGIPMLAAARPYRQYKRAYENNLFKNNLIDSLAHNIKTPLQILGGYAENLKDVDDPASKDHYADRILEKTAEMNKDIEAILKTAERTTPELKNCSVKDIIAEAAGKIGGEFDITGDAQMPADKEYFAQAVYALLDNAARYKTSGSVQVKVDKNAVVITNKTDKDNFTPGTGLAIAGRILEQNKMNLTTAIKGGVFEARISRK